jgi:uncharacterized protein
LKLEHSFTVPVGIDEAWKILLDIERVAPCMPGAKLESFDGDELTGNVKVKLGAINLTYKGKASFVEKDEAAHRAVLDARGRDARGNGTATARVTTSLTEEGGATTVMVNTDLDVTGKVAQFGRGVMVDVGNKLIGQFADCLAKQIESGDGAVEAAPSTAPETAEATSADPPDASPAGSGGGAPADAIAAAQATAAVGAIGSADAEASTGESAPKSAADYAAPTAEATSEANGRSAFSDGEVEPINLLQSAGPAIAKRAVPPLAVLLFIVLLIVLRRRRS